MADVFVSYSRRDDPFVRRLHEALVAAGRQVWVDWEGIPSSAKWMEEVRGAIDAADLFLFVVSPDSAASPTCREEAGHAADVGKRIVPVVCRDTPPSDLPDAISSHNWLFLRESDDFDAGVARLLVTLDTDPDWVKAHTRLVARAREWEEAGRDRSRLLRGRDLEAAERALVQGVGRDPRPTPLQSAYVAASRDAERRGQRVRTALLVGGLVAALGLAAVALVQRSTAESNAALAEQQRAAAEQQRSRAETEATLAKARELTAAAGRALATDPELSVLLAREAVSLVPDEGEDRGLREALQASRMRARYVGQGGQIRSVDLSADGTRLVTASTDGSVVLWDRATRRPMVTTRVSGTQVEHAAVSPDGSRFAAVSDDGAIAVWTSDGTRIGRWRAHGDRAVDVAFSPDGTRLVTAGLDGAATIWDAADWHRVLTVHPLAGEWMTSAAFTTDGHRLLTTSSDLSTRLWDATTGIQLAEFIGPSRQPFAGAASSDGALVATGAQDETARIWDARSMTELQVLPHSGEVYTVDFSPDGHRLVTASSDGRVRIWDVKTGQLVDTLIGHDGAVNGVVWAPDGRAVVTAGRDGTIREWAASAVDPRVIYGGHFGSVVAGDLSADGTHVATSGGEDRAVIVYDTSTGKPIVTIRGHEDAVSAIRFSRDGHSILTGSFDRSARLWDATTGAELHRYDGNTDGVLDAAISPDSAMVATGGADRTVRTWATDGTPGWSRTLPDQVLAVGFSPDGTVLYAGDGSGELIAFDITDGTERFRLDVGSGIQSLAPSPDGTRLAVLGLDARTRIWDLAGRRISLELPATSGFGWAVRYSPDGRLVSTGGDDGSIHVWDASNGERYADLRVDARDAFIGQFLPDGSGLIATTRTSQAVLVPCDLCGSTADVLKLATARTTRELTADERTAFLHEQLSPSAPTATASTPPEATPEPLPSPSVTPTLPSCDDAASGCVAAGSYTSHVFDIPIRFDHPGLGGPVGEHGAMLVLTLAAGDQVSFADGSEFHGSNGRSLTVIGTTVAGLEAYFRGLTWMKVGPAHALVVDGRPARIMQITSDSDQQPEFGAAGGDTAYWGTGETLDLALIDGPRGPLIVFGDRVSDTPQPQFDATFETILRSIRFR